MLLTQGNYGHIVEIPNVEWVKEILAEKFDSAGEILTPNSIIYGGAVRDCLSGKELLGDLDVAVPATESNKIIDNLESSPKWSRNRNNRYREDYKGSKRSPIACVYEYKNVFNRVMQAIMVRGGSGKESDPLGSTINVAKHVDIVCCGVFMTVDGRVFEALPGAFNDCVKTNLRFNTLLFEPAHAIHANINSLHDRIKKLESRGWKNRIDADRVKSIVKNKISKNKKRASKGKGLYRETSKSFGDSLTASPDYRSIHTYRWITEY